MKQEFIVQRLTIVGILILASSLLALDTPKSPQPPSSAEQSSETAVLVRESKKALEEVKDFLLANRDQLEGRITSGVMMTTFAALLPSQLRQLESALTSERNRRSSSKEIAELDSALNAIAEIRRDHGAAVRSIVGLNWRSGESISSSQIDAIAAYNACIQKTVRALEALREVPTSTVDKAPQRRPRGTATPPAGAAARRQKTADDKIIPFHSVNGLIPGLSTQKEAVKQLGPAEQLESSGETKIVSYASRGITLIFSVAQSNTPDPQIDSIYVEVPYPGRTPNGLYLGMPKRSALEILRKDYTVSDDLGDSLLFSVGDGSARLFQVWFEDDVLIRMKLFK